MNLVSKASTALQSLDEWTDEMESGKGLDFGTAIDQIENLRAVAEEVIKREV